MKIKTFYTKYSRNTNPTDSEVLEVKYYNVKQCVAENVSLVKNVALTVGLVLTILRVLVIMKISGDLLHQYIF